MPNATDRLEQLLGEIADRRAEAEANGRSFTARSEAELEQLLAGGIQSDVFVTDTEWDQYTKPGSPGYYLVNFTNVTSSTLIVRMSIFFGLGGLSDDIPTAVQMRDQRWPCVSTQGILVEPGATGVAMFRYVAPYATLGTYLGTGILWSAIEPLLGRSPIIYERTMFEVTLRMTTPA